MFIPAFTSGTASGASMGASFSPYVAFSWGPIRFLLDGIVGTFITNGFAQVFDFLGNLLAGLV